MELIKTCYQYPNKSCLLTAADVILTPLRGALNGKRVFFDASNKVTSIEDNKVKNVFLRVILAICALIILPLTLLACLKVFSKENEKFHKEFSSQHDKAVEDAGECSICTDELKEAKKAEITKTKCDHFFHTACITEWVNRNETTNRCPVCQTPEPLT